MASSIDEAIAPGHAQDTARPGVSLTDLLLLCTSAIWGVNYIVVKYGTEVLRPLAYNGARVALAAVVLGALAVARYRERVARRDVFALLALGVLGNCLYQLFFAEGVARTRAGNAALVLAAVPVFIAGIGRMLGVERVGARGIGGIVLSMIGIALVVFGGTGDATQESTLLGNLLVLAGAICWSLFTVLLKPYTHRVSLPNISALTMVGGSVPLALVSAPAIVATDWRAVAPLTWAAIVYSGIGALVLAYLFWYRGVRALGPTRTAMYSNLQPVIALLVAWAVLREVPTLWQGVGAGTIIAGVILTRT